MTIIIRKECTKSDSIALGIWTTNDKDKRKNVIEQFATMTYIYYASNDNSTIAAVTPNSMIQVIKYGIFINKLDDNGAFD